MVERPVLVDGTGPAHDPAANVAMARYYFSYDVAETAALLGMTESQVRTASHEATLKLRRSARRPAATRHGAGGSGRPGGEPGVNSRGPPARARRTIPGRSAPTSDILAAAVGEARRRRVRRQHRAARGQRASVWSRSSSAVVANSPAFTTGRRRVPFQAA